MEKAKTQKANASLKIMLALTICLTILVHAGKAQASFKPGRNPGKSTMEVLFDNYPNPFSGVTNIKYTVAEQSQVEMGIYNLLGSKIVSLEDEVKSEGMYNKQWDATNFPEGIYILSLKVDGKPVKRKFMVIQ